MLQQSNNQANINLVTFYAKFFWFGRYLYYMSFLIQPPKRLMHVCNFPVWCFPCQQTWLGRSTVGICGWTLGPRGLDKLILGPRVGVPTQGQQQFHALGLHGQAHCLLPTENAPWDPKWQNCKRSQTGFHWFTYKKTTDAPNWGPCGISARLPWPRSLKLYPLWACIGMLAGSQHNDWWSHSTGWWVCLVFCVWLKKCEKQCIC